MFGLENPKADRPSSIRDTRQVNIYQKGEVVRLTKKILATTAMCLSLALSSEFAVLPASGATLSAATIAQKISKAGLGCKDLKSIKVKILYGGKRWTCTVKGKKTNLEL